MAQFDLKTRKMPRDLGPVDRVLWPHFDWAKFIKDEKEVVIVSWTAFQPEEQARLSAGEGQGQGLFDWSVLVQNGLRGVRVALTEKGRRLHAAKVKERWPDR